MAPFFAPIPPKHVPATTSTRRARDASPTSHAGANDNADESAAASVGTSAAATDYAPDIGAAPFPC